MKLTKQETEFINDQNVCRVATVSDKGLPHLVPVCAVLVTGKLYFASETGAKKVRNIEAHPHATIVFDVYSDSWKKIRGVMLQCRARIVDQAEFKKARRRLYAKYPQYEKEAPLEPEDSVIVEMEPVKKFSWGFKD